MEPENSQKALQILSEIRLPTEVLANLLYLIKLEASKADQVLRYVEIAESQVELLVKVIERESSR